VLKLEEVMAETTQQLQISAVGSLRYLYDNYCQAVSDIEFDRQFRLFGIVAFCTYRQFLFSYSGFT